MAEENQVGGVAGELTEEQKAAQAEKEAAEAAEKAKSDAEAAAGNAGGEEVTQASGAASSIVPGSVVSFTIALGEVRDATVVAANGDGSLDLVLALKDEDRRYIPHNEREQATISRPGAKLGEAGKDVYTWSLKTPDQRDQLAEDWEVIA